MAEWRLLLKTLFARRVVLISLVVLALIVKLGALVSVAVVLKLRLGLALPPAWFPAASV